MGQSATLYRISQHDFERLKEVGIQNFQLLSTAKERVTFQKTFMGLEFVLAKEGNEDHARIVQWIFNPTHSVGGKDLSGYDLTFMDHEEMLKLLEGDDSVFYNPPDKTKSINNVICNVSETAFIQKFDPDELNSNDIYPGVWNRDTSPHTAFNESDILNDFKSLKK
jgi:hypothetical protein